MKTINLKNTKTQTFFDPETGKYTGFAGVIKLFKNSVYMDTRTGIGYDKAIKELEPYVNYLANKYNFSGLGYSFEDTKQHIIMRILEGIPQYDPTKDTKLSTFLYMRIERRIINEIRNLSTDSKNPTTLKTSLFSVTCECQKKFIISINSDESIDDKHCYNCNRTLENAKTYSINKPPESLDSVIALKTLKYVDDKHRMSIDDIISEDSFDIPLVYGEKPKLEDSVISKHDFEKWIGAEDAQIKQLVRLVCFEDYSVKAAAEVVGISHTGASNKLKRLGRKKKIRDMFGR